MSAAGTAPSGEAERVRACARCGELVAFELRTCPHCGHHEPLVVFTTLGDEQQPCRVCRTPQRAELLFCARCGAEQVPAPVGGPGLERTPEADGRALAVVAILLTLLGPLTLLAAVASVYWA